MDGELKPCPMCEGEAQTRTEQSQWVKVFCGSCGLFAKSFNTKHAAIHYWNTRAPSAPKKTDGWRDDVGGLLEQLEAALTNYHHSIAHNDEPLACQASEALAAVQKFREGAG